MQPSAACRVPPEIWQAIFKRLTTLQLHILDQSAFYRRRLIGHLLPLLLVSRAWHDIAKPLVYMHPAFEWITRDNFIRFADSLDRGDEPGSPKASWVHTFYLCRPLFPVDYLNDKSRKFDATFASLLPRFTALRELSCLMYITVEEFDILTHTCGRTLTKLVMHFSPSAVADSIPLMERLVMLEDLHITILERVPTFYVHTPLVLPKLRMLSVDAQDYNMNWFLKCLMRSSFPKLTSFAFRCGDAKRSDCASLVAFLTAHGENLTDLRYWSADRESIALVFPLTPRLTHIDIVDLGNHPGLLAGLPRSVSTITHSCSTAWHAPPLDVLLEAVENLPRPNMLRPILLHEAQQCFDYSPLSWKRMDPEGLRLFAWRAARLLPLGIVVMDDEGVVLTDIVSHVKR